MPYKVHTKDGNPYCVEKLNGEDVGCSDKKRIGAYLGKLNSVAENEIEESSLKIFKKGELKKKYEETKEKVVDAINDERIKTSEAYKLITSGKKLTPEEKDKVKKQLGSLLTIATKSAIFLAPGGSLVLLAFNLISNKVKKREPEEIMENKLVGGRADNETVKDIAKKFRVTVKYLKKQLKKGVKVESEHTDDKEKQKEIASDHLAEFPNYYEELEGMEKKLKDYWKDKLKNEENMNESKILIKKLLRENLNNSSLKKEIYDRIEAMGLNPNEVPISINGEPAYLGQGPNENGEIVENVGSKVAKFFIAVEIVAGTLVSCKKEEVKVMYKCSYQDSRTIDKPNLRATSFYAYDHILKPDEIKKEEIRIEPETEEMLNIEVVDGTLKLEFEEVDTEGKW